MLSVTYTLISADTEFKYLTRVMLFCYRSLSAYVCTQSKYAQHTYFLSSYVKDIPKSSQA